MIGTKAVERQMRRKAEHEKKEEVRSCNATHNFLDFIDSEKLWKDLIRGKM